MRVAYLGLLWVLGLTAWQYTIGWEQTAALGDNARFCFLLFPALALTAVFLVLYLCLVQGLGKLPAIAGWLGMQSSHPWLAVESWQKWLNPFQAMESVLETTAEDAAAFAPPYRFAVAMLVITFLLNAWAILRLRVWNPSGEPVMQREAPGTEADEDKDRAAAHAAPGAGRAVWANPILWREICTRAYGRRPLLVKVAYFVALALICAFALEPLWA